MVWSSASWEEGGYLLRSVLQDIGRWRQAVARLAWTPDLEAGVVAIRTAAVHDARVFGDPRRLGELLGALLLQVRAAARPPDLARMLRAMADARWSDPDPDHPLWPALAAAAPIVSADAGGLSS